MSSIAVSSIVFACIFGGALFGVLLRRMLPQHHLCTESRDVVKLGMGLVATLTALVLGLLIATAKGSFDAQNAAIKELSTKVILLDSVLAAYGPETKEERELLRTAIGTTANRLWPGTGEHGSVIPGESRAPLEAMYDKIASLSPQTDKQRVLKGRALDFTVELVQSRLRLFAQDDTSLPLLFFVVLVFWLVILFAGYGVLAPCHATVVSVLILCAISVSGAIFLTLEMTTPFSGMIRVSNVPLNEAIALIGH